jgi:hypothetical protein
MRSSYLKLIALVHHFLHHGAHLCLGEAVAAILIPDIEDLSELLLLLKGPLAIDCLRVDTESMEEVLGHDGELIESEKAVLIGVISIKQLLEALNDLFLLCSDALFLLLLFFVDEIVELHGFIGVNSDHLGLVCFE